MLEFIQVTAQYSNAVLVAILPQISDFAAKLELPVPLPIRAEHVQTFKCSFVKGHIGGHVIFTNHLEVWYGSGHVDGFRTPHSYYNLQDARDIPKLYGPIKLNKEEALQFARSHILKLGYTLKETFTDQEPEIDSPPQIGTNMVPHYRFRWKDPVFGSTAVSIEVDAGRKMIHEMNLSSPFFWRVPPKIAVEPEVRNPKPPVSAAVSNQFLSATLPKVSKFSQKLELPFKFPVTQKQVEKVEFFDFDSDVRIKLTNGYWFVFREGAIIEFTAPDAVYSRGADTFEPFTRPLEEYLGKWQLSEKEGIELVRQTIEKLGYTVEEFHLNREPQVTKPDQVGDYVVPRYSFRWLTNNPATGNTIALVRAEVDANSKTLKHLQLIKENRTKLPGADLKPIPETDSPAPPLFYDTNAAKKILPKPKPSSPYE